MTSTRWKNNGSWASGLPFPQNDYEDYSEVADNVQKISGDYPYLASRDIPTTNPQRARRVIARPVAETVADQSVSQANHDRSVSIQALYTKGSIFAFIVALASIIFWLVAAMPLISPFVSFCILVVSPITYLMGRAKA